MHSMETTETTETHVSTEDCGIQPRVFNEPRRDKVSLEKN